MDYRIAFFGDDFTGSTDALETLEEMGLASILFTEVPDPEQLKAHAGKQAIGVAGMTRTMPTAEIGQYLQVVFERIREIAPIHFHYKVCSTFDSSPTVGSIGKAIDVGSSVFGATLVPLVVGAPYLGRYCVFGNLFARMGTSSAGAAFRLDRHPSMSQHPVTPADESDLMLHLSRQTDKKIGLVDVIDLDKPMSAVSRIAQGREAEGAEIVLFDTLSSEHLEKIGEVIDGMAIASRRPVFSVGSSAVSKALCAAWVKDGSVTPRTRWPELKAAKPLLVLSGSCSAVTAGQIEWALENGFEQVPVDTEALAATRPDQHVSETAARTLHFLNAGKSVIVHTSIGPQDNRIDETTAILANKVMSIAGLTDTTAKLHGTALARIADEVISQFPVSRLVVVGGDTSSLFARALGIRAVEMIAPGVRGAPLCRAYSNRPHIDGLTVNFKGGQVGDIDYFLRIQEGIKGSQDMDTT